MKQFLGFTPDQASKMLQQKGLRANTREGAEYLAGMHKRAQDMLEERGFQYGGQVGGFDNKSSKLFDAAVKRTASTEPKSPEVQRYLDNVIETRGNPTMVYPTTADPLMGYDNGGDVTKDIKTKRAILASRISPFDDTFADDRMQKLYGKEGMEKNAIYNLAEAMDDLYDTIGQPKNYRQQYFDNIAKVNPDQNATQKLLTEMITFLDTVPKYGAIEILRNRQIGNNPPSNPFSTQEPSLAETNIQEKMLRDIGTYEAIKAGKLKPPPEFAFNEDLLEEEMLKERLRILEENKELMKPKGGPLDDRQRYKGRKSEKFKDFLERQRRDRIPKMQEGGDVINPDDPVTGQPVPDTDPNVVNPFPTTGGNTDAKARDEARKNLNTAQAELATERQKLSNLQQELAKLPTDETSDKRRQELVDQITNMGVTLTQKEAAVSSASSAFQSVGIPTAAEAVGTAVSTPDDILTRQQVNLMPTDDTSIAKQLITKGTGKVDDRTDKTATQGVADTVGDPTQPDTITKTASKVAQDIRDEALTKTTGTLSPDAEATAQIIKTEDLAINDTEAATDTNNVQVDSPAKRKFEQGEKISGVANAEIAKNFLEGVEAATGAPSSQATVQGQLTSLMTQFEGGNPPPWAAGAMRQATAIMAQRGLAASSMAGQAIVQAAMESALPIAMQDAKTVASFEAQNISNRQQRAILAAQQRAQFLGMEFDQAFEARVRNAATVSDIANRNFTAEVQIALENAQLAQTTDMSILSNKQAVVMAKAAALQQADMANLNNRQQAEVRNADAFLQMDMKNFDAEQQVDMFKNQSIIQGLFTDTASENAMKQFNATSENQANQFFLKLETQVDEFNSAQKNAMEQFNAGEDNALTKFQEELNNQRDLFNARNELVIAQANAQWRQQLTTINTAAQNEANRQDALQANALTQKGLDEIWQRERDLMSYAFASAENAETRRVELLKAELSAEGAADTAYSSALGNFAGAVVNGIFGYYGSKLDATARVAAAVATKK